MTMDNSYWPPNVGSEIKIRTVRGKNLSGEVYTFDSVTDSLIIRNPSSIDQNKWDLNILPKIGIANIEVLKEGSPNMKALPILSASELEAKERKALEEASERLKRFNVDATLEGQALFDGLSKTLPCEWVGQAIQVLDQVRIDPPYSKESCVSLDNNNASFQRILKMVEGIKQKFSRQKSH